MSRKIRQQICANCKHSFKEGENFCPHCGQDNHSPNQPIKHYTTELLESLLHLDSKIFLTIGTMLWYPGKITREYNENMRARYTPPVRLYIFISFIFFVLLQIPGKNDNQLNAFNTQNEVADSTENLVSLDTLVSNEDADTSENKFKIFRVDKNKEHSGKLHIMGFTMSHSDMLKYKNASNSQIDSLLISQNLAPNYFTRTLVKQILKSADNDKDLMGRIKEKTIHFSSLALFLLMPFFALLLFLAYFRRRKYYYEYLIFSIHYHTVAFLFFSLIILVNIFWEAPSWVYWIYFFGLLFYLGKALRYNYQGSRKRTILKMTFICFIYLMVSLIVFSLALALGWWFV